ncbi:hypothetical protein RHSIM_Rhsim04G0005100 [Rhododendron simsii]|uniref:Uncharacterized protein n=1 Tax=Rhododendron simsii TaxID=118357 RepID=A0A834LS84_RHOSS|nr:hypothetical protein RHSIM_Rhsim04G0005100 [Rhododendron simsii]
MTTTSSNLTVNKLPLAAQDTIAIASFSKPVPSTPTYGFTGFIPDPMGKKKNKTIILHSLTMFWSFSFDDDDSTLSIFV